MYGFVGLIVSAAGLAMFFAGYLLASWRPGDPLADAGDLYVQATAMTYAGIVAGQVGAGFALRTARESLLRVGLFSNRSLLAGIALRPSRRCSRRFIRGPSIRGRGRCWRSA